MDNERIARLLKKTQWSFAISMLTLLTAILLIDSDMAGEGTWGGVAGNVLIWSFLISGIAFLVFLGVLVHRLGRSALLWLLLVILFSPLAAVIAVVRVRQIVGVQGGSQPRQSLADGS